MKIRESAEKGIYIQDLTEEYICDEEEFYEYMYLGNKNR